MLVNALDLINVHLHVTPCVKHHWVITSFLQLGSRKVCATLKSGVPIFHHDCTLDFTRLLLQQAIRWFSINSNR